MFLLSACPSVPENRYFTLAYSLLPTDVVSRGDRTAATLRVRQFEIGPAYDTERLVYRYSPYEFQYYNFMLWATKPQKMVTDMVIRHLRHSGLFAKVDSEFLDNPPDYELTGEISAIEELDSGDEWFAHIAMNLRLSRYRSDRPLWSKSIDVKKKVYNKAPVYVVKALSELIEQQLRLVTKELADVVGGKNMGAGEN
ncbi:MAG: hypothetical protein D6806_11200 [Deltaproteobacteria bacterium]|nr:MAG: hypothetical protein D6806_11200 [Deltaproteobacteria bacterium]